MGNLSLNVMSRQPDADTAVTAPSSQSSAFARLKRFYARYAPDKGDEDINKLLEKYGDRMEELLSNWWTSTVLSLAQRLSIEKE